jgi:hypothetical protein
VARADDRDVQLLHGAQHAMAACPRMASRMLAPALAALACLALPAGAAAQSGGTEPPGPGDPCPGSYPGADAPKAQLARWMARGAAVEDLPEELPVMAALAESGLRNLNRRGNPFAGFFSMSRVLNKGDLRGFPRDPDLQLRWFTDTATVVRQREIAEGDDDFGSDSSGYGLWIADVERPAPENRSGYQRYFDDADELVEGLCRPSSHLPDRTPPKLRLKLARRQRDRVVARVRCPVEDCVAAAQAKPARRVRSARAVAVEDDPVTLTLPARTRRSARLIVTVTAVDESGNARSLRRRVTLLR